MELVSVPIVGYTPPAWRPAYAMPRVTNPRLGDAPVSTARLSFIDSPFVSLITDVVAASSIAMVGYIYYKGKSDWSNLFFALAALAGVKAIVDIKRLQ